jgi:diguanylate cyclase (GGDEF)-like protein
MGDIENKHIMNDAKSALDTSELNIISNLQELENMLVYLSETVRLMILHGADYEMVSKYVTDINDYILDNEKYKIYSTGVYGFFDVFGGKFHDGAGWIPPSGYTPSDRPWYKAAIEANGKTTVTEPYMAMAKGVYTMTFTRRIFSADGKPLGIVCLDIILDRVRELIANTHFEYKGYGVLLNSQLEILAHPDKTMYGKKMLDINISLLPIVESLKQGIPVLEHRIKNYKGKPSVLFLRQIENGWYIAVMISEAAYFKEMRIMRLAIIVLGTILATLFIGIFKKLTIANEKLEALSTTDELTKLNNRRSFLEYINLIWKQNHRLNLPVTILMIDIDYFKKYNDSLGHLEGDKALVAIAKCLKNNIKRETDFVARFGGEEFVCVLPFVEKIEGFEFTKTMVQSVEDMKIPHPMNSCSKYLTISAGIASAVPDGNNSHIQLLDEADKALYSAKASGRNRVVMS